MLTQDDNELLTRVGPGTPMGQLIRRYWLPVCLSEELPDSTFRDRVKHVGYPAGEHDGEDIDAGYSRAVAKEK